jgi:hypothetical protein
VLRTRKARSNRPVRSRRFDRRLFHLLNNIRSQLLSLVIRNWEKNPDNYSAAFDSIYVLMERPFAPVNTRLRARRLSAEAGSGSSSGAQES